MKTVHVSVGRAVAILVWAFVPFAGHSMQFDEEYRTVADAAQDLAPRIAAEVKKEAEKRGGLLSVAVMAFGDEDGKVGESLFFAAKTLQGELTSELRNRAERKFVVWDPAQLRNKVREAGADLAKIRVDAVEAAAEELKKLGLDAAVVGSYQTGGEEADRFVGPGQPIHVHADILFTEGAPLQLTSNVESIDVVPEVPGIGLSGRFCVDVLVDGAALPMYVEAAEQHFGSRKFLLDLDRAQHYGKPFTIRVRNEGMPPAGWISASERAERSRFFCAAVLVDGVNSFYQREADDEFHASQRLPQNLTKWVLTAPGTRVSPGYDTDRNLRAQQSVRGPGGSVVDVRGFQLNDKTAALFEFADAGDSLAHEVGVTKDIGVISVYFYSERMKGDQEYFGPNVAAMAADAGARTGRSVENSVLRVNVRTHPDPVEIWQVFYRYGGHPDSVQEGRRAGKQYESVDRILDRARAEYRSAGDPFRER